MKYSAVILAAGQGTRYKEKKQDIIFHNKELWRYSYETTKEVVGESRIVVVGKDIEGGKTRAKSVLNGLLALPRDTDRVVIVEAARPMVTQNQILEIIKSKYLSISYVRPLVNTVIFKDGRYINREDLYDLLTPQAFDYKLLLEAYKNGNFNDVTDDTRIMYEFHGIKPYLIETENNLFKVTYPGDLEIIEAIYKKQKGE